MDYPSWETRLAEYGDFSLEARGLGGWPGKRLTVTYITEEELGVTHLAFKQGTARCTCAAEDGILRQARRLPDQSGAHERVRVGVLVENKMAVPAVSLSGLCKRFGELQAVSDVSFEVYPGEIFGLLGPNGAGKTTTIRMMLDIFRPDCGEVQLFGARLDESAKNRIGYLPEERGLYRDLKLEPTLIYLAELKGLDERTARHRLAEWLERFDLYEHRGKKVQELSRGMQQKAQLIATLLHEPDLIVLDEPFSGLDPVNTRLVKTIIEEQRRAGRTVIMSTHQMHQVEAMCNRIVLIDRGHSVLYGEVEAIKRSFAGNAVTVAGRGDLDQFPSLPGVLEIRQTGENGRSLEDEDVIAGQWHLTLAPGADPQRLLRAIAADDRFKIERYELASPTLDDIFVAVVQGESLPVRAGGQSAELVPPFVPAADRSPADG